MSLFAFGAASAWADVGTVACNATAGIAPLVRAEGAAERSGDVLIVCSGGTPATAGAAIPTINVQVFLNTNVSSRLMYSSGSATEALLLIDDPAPASQYLATQNPPFTGSVTAVGGGVYTPSAARPNVFAGNLMSASSVGFMGIPFDPPGASVPQRTLRLTNIRVNASQLGPGTSLVPSSVLMFITISGSSSLTLDNPQVTIGTVQTGMSFSVTAGAAAQCDPGIKTASLRFAETFSTAFLARGSGEQNVPGTLNNTESLFVNSSFGGVYANAGRATQGTHLIARFSGVPSGVSLYVPAGAGTTYLNDSSVATPVGNPLSGITAQGNTLALVAAGTSGSTADASGLVALTGGAGAAVYEVTTGSPGSIDTITIPVQIVYKATPAAALGTITASGSLAPIDPTATASFTAAAPRFVDTAQAVTLFSLSACSFSMSLNRSALAFAAVAGTDTLTPSQSVILSLSNASAQWVASSSQPWLSVSPASGSGSATLTIALVPASLPAGGTNSATITISAPQGGSNPIQIVCSLVMKPASAAPFGSFDTPVDNSTGLAGAIPVTGWALDDVAVERVALWRDPVPPEPSSPLIFIGDALFVPGTRPDVETNYSSYPLAYRAGWGYMLLTNFLPGQGNGTYRLYAFANDKDGHIRSLGSKSINVTNSAAVKPFGTVDTPAQGGTASGAAFVNFGWALTPQPAAIATDGSTIRVFVDGVLQGNATYNNPRSDIDTLFPGYANTGGAVGYYRINTTLLANGLHTLAWVVSDNQSRSDGIGSRYFNVVNGASGASGAAKPLAVATYQDVEPLLARGGAATPAVRRGYDLETPLVELRQTSAGRSETFVVEETERLEIHLPEAASWTGYHRVGDELRPLPVGSSFDAQTGVFLWQLGPGFLGDHELVFAAADQALRVPVRILPLRPQLGARGRSEKQ